MNIKRRLINLYFGILHGMKDDVDRVLWSINPDLPQEIHADSFERDGVKLDMYAQKNDNEAYNVVRYTGRRIFGPVTGHTLDKYDAYDVDIRTAVRLLHEWNKARDEEGLKRELKPVAGSGYHYRVIAQKLDIPLKPS